MTVNRHNKKPIDNTWVFGKWVDAPLKHMQDKETGVVFDVLTGGIGNNTHIYFNCANFTSDGRYLIFRSDHTGSWQVYAYDIAGQRPIKMNNNR